MCSAFFFVPNTYFNLRQKSRQRLNSSVEACYYIDRSTGGGVLKRHLKISGIITVLTLLLVGFVACSGGGGSNSGEVANSTFSMSLDFERIDAVGHSPFDVTLSLSESGDPVTDASGLQYSCDRGTTGGIVNNGDGTYTFRVTPSQTGEHKVTVTYEGQSVTQTALVLEDVDSAWGQPMAVSGLVNTEGYEDGVTISPDGQYLFVQTGPYRWSALLVYALARSSGGCGNNRLSPTRCEHPWVNEMIGTITAPERPDFFSARFRDGQYLHNAVSWGVGEDEAPIFAVSTMFYGFKRQTDGSFREPFYMAFNDLEDGIIGPMGLTFRKKSDETWDILFSLKDSYTTSAGFDVYHMNSPLGANINLGDYALSSPSNPPVRGSYFPSTLVDLGDNSGTQGNSFLRYDSTNGSIQSLWTDDEYDSDSDTHKLSVYTFDSGTFPSSGTWTKVVLPANVNVSGTEAIQPTFSDEGLYFTQNTNVVFSAYSGAHTSSGYGTNGNWSLPTTLLKKDTTASFPAPASSDLGKVIALGEPTVATVNGKKELYFVYAYVRSIDATTGYGDLNFQAGVIRER